jgi:chemotaxis protein CheD
VGVVLYERAAKLGGLAHIVLPKANGVIEHPGKYADTAIPTLVTDFERRLGGRGRARLIAKLIGGATMFQMDPSIKESSALNIGRRNLEAIEQILRDLAIPVLARDVGGTAGRRLTLDTISGIVTIKVPGVSDYQL